MALSVEVVDGLTDILKNAQNTAGCKIVDSVWEFPDMLSEREDGVL